MLIVPGLFASGQGMFTVVNFVNNHTCTVSRLNLDHKECSAKFIANLIKDQLVGNQNYTPAMIITEIQKSFGVRVSYKKAYNALQIALVFVHGDFDESYKDLPSYLRELRIHDHGTTVKLLCCNATHCFRQCVSLKEENHGNGSWKNLPIASLNLEA
ncbi:hypothetical protein Cni_G19568 [Canna indica]|uniref:Uncharacterized protein n=1 Tax=Canna indica TaxID=4628 RepID=A0AAQ3KLH4_9LILI|nr:hypothetical protein Cni_G19568 [Canna indica]